MTERDWAFIALGVWAATITIYVVADVVANIATLQAKAELLEALRAVAP